VAQVGRPGQPAVRLDDLDLGGDPQRHLGALPGAAHGIGVRGEPGGVRADLVGEGERGEPAWSAAETTTPTLSRPAAKPVCTCASIVSGPDAIDHRFPLCAH
jgi:hypothetical protein